MGLIYVPKIMKRKVEGVLIDFNGFMKFFFAKMKKSSYILP